MQLGWHIKWHRQTALLYQSSIIPNCFQSFFTRFGVKGVLFTQSFSIYGVENYTVELGCVATHCCCCCWYVFFVSNFHIVTFHSFHIRRFSLAIHPLCMCHDSEANGNYFPCCYFINSRFICVRFKPNCGVLLLYPFAECVVAVCWIAL